MEEYIVGHINKTDILQNLMLIESPFAELYKGRYPANFEVANKMWRDFEKRLTEYSGQNRAV